MEGSEQILRRVTMALVGVVVVAVVVLGAIGLVLGVWPLGLLAGAVVGGGLVRKARGRSDEALLSALGARRADEETFRRYHNLVDGLCVSAGVPRPQLWVISDDAANALVLGRGATESCMALTTGLLDRLQRIELEAVVARLLAQIKAGDTRVAGRVSAFAATVAPLGDAASRVMERFLEPDRVTWADMSGCRITRFPPGLIAALEHLATCPTEPAVSPASVSPLWLVPVNPAADLPTLEQRIAMLREL